MFHPNSYWPQTPASPSGNHQKNKTTFYVSISKILILVPSFPPFPFPFPFSFTPDSEYHHSWWYHDMIYLYNYNIYLYIVDIPVIIPVIIDTMANLNLAWCHAESPWTPLVNPQSRLLDALSGQKEIFRRSQQRVLLAMWDDWGAQTDRGISKNYPLVMSK